MRRDPLKHFERLAEVARTEAASPLEVADDVLHTIQQYQTSRLDDSLHATLWFAVATSCTAAVMLWFAWPALEMTAESYALMWSPLTEILP